MFITLVKYITLIFFLTFRAIIISFKILPKILSVYPHASNSADSAKVLTWAIKDLDLMNYFFENLKEFTNAWPSVKESDELVSEREQQIQSRLDFLSAMYSNEITPDHFRKSKYWLNMFCNN